MAVLGVVLQVSVFCKVQHRRKVSVFEAEIMLEQVAQSLAIADSFTTAVAGRNFDVRDFRAPYGTCMQVMLH
jgi:hypothetical protein